MRYSIVRFSLSIIRKELWEFDNLKNLLKKIILVCLHKLGLLNLIHYRKRKKITVLMLHGVMSVNTKSLWVPLRPQVSPQELERTLEILSECYQFITIDECISMLNGEIPLVDHGMLITFDDGYYNTIKYGLPICEKFGVKPVFFLTTGHLDSGLPFWFDRLDYALQQNMGEVIKFEFNGVIYSFNATSRTTLKASYSEFRDKCKIAFTDDIAMNKLFESLAKSLESRSGMSLSDICREDDWSSITSWQQLKKIVREQRLSIGSHTVDHWRVDNLPEDKVLWQLLGSKNRIEEELSVECNYFCYPNGNYNKLAIKLLKDSGYKAAFSTDAGLCSIKDNVMTLKRFNFPINKTKSEIIFNLNR